METVCAPNTTQADRRCAHEFYWNLISLLQPFMWKNMTYEGKISEAAAQVLLCLSWETGIMEKFRLEWFLKLADS